MKKIYFLIVSLVLLATLSSCLTSRAEISPSISQQILKTVSLGMTKDEVKATVGFAGTENKAGDQWFYPTFEGDWVILRFEGSALTLAVKFRIAVSDSSTSGTTPETSDFTEISLEKGTVTLTDAALFDEIKENMNIWEAAKHLNFYGYYLTGTYAPTYYGTDGSTLSLFPTPGGNAGGQNIKQKIYTKAGKKITLSLVEQLACGMPWEDVVSILGSDGVDVVDALNNVHLRLFPLKEGGILSLQAVSVDAKTSEDKDSDKNFFLVRALLHNIPLETNKENYFVLPDWDKPSPTVTISSAVRANVACLSYGMESKEVQAIFGTTEQLDDQDTILADITYRLSDGSLLIITYTNTIPSSTELPIVLIGRSIYSVTLDGVALQTDEAGNFLLPDA